MIVPLFPAGKYLDMFIEGSSALSMIKSHCSFMLESCLLVDSKSSLNPQISAISRNPRSAVSLLLASIQKMAQKLAIVSVYSFMK